MSGYITPKSASLPPAETTPASRAATGSLWFAMFILVANLVMTMAWAMTVSAADSPVAVWVVEIVQLLLVLTLFTFALVLGVRGLRETTSGDVRGRGRAVAGLVVASVLLVFTAFGIVGQLELTFLG